jgi:hypothetical protein
MIYILTTRSWPRDLKCHILSHGHYGNCLIIFQRFRILDIPSLRFSAKLKPHLSGHANIKHHIVTTKRRTCVGIPTAEINWCVVTIFPRLKVPVIAFPQVQMPTNVSAYKTVNPLAPSDPYMGRTAQLTSRRCILNTYSTNICTEYFKHAA